MPASRLVAILLAPVVGLLALGACSSTGGPSAAGGGRVSVVVTTTQLADFAKVIGGDHVTVYGVVKANVDPHDYEPSPADIDALADADVIVKNGVGLERWFDDTITSAAPSGEVVDASSGVAIRGGDPHIWHDPTNAAIMVGNIEHALERADPAHTADYQRSLADYDAQLRQLDADTRAKVALLPDKQLVTDHDAFGYYVDHYGLRLVGTVIPTFDTSAGLSAQQIAELVAKIKATGVRAIFTESSLPAKAAEAIGTEAGVRVIGGADSLYGDTLGPAGSDGDTYLKMEAHNTRVIVDNLS
jgi:zinc/manganese transport system substrate-binding protein/manganese/iron transport system substrate-binding protein